MTITVIARTNGKGPKPARRLWDVRPVPVTVTEPQKGSHGHHGRLPGERRTGRLVTFTGHTWEWYCHRCTSASMATFIDAALAADAARTHSKRVCSALGLTARQRLDMSEES